MQGDDRRHRREAHLEAGAGERFRPEQKDGQRADGDEANADRIAAEGDPGQDQQGGNAASDRRDLGAGEQRVAEPGGRGDAGAVVLMPSLPGWAFGLMVAGGLWLCLWNTRLRLFGLLPVAVGAAGAMFAVSPDVLVTGDGKHLAVVRGGTPLLLRDRAGDFVRQLFAEASGFDGDPGALGARPYSDCTRDACVAVIRESGREWRILATRSAYRIDWETVTRACADADIVVSDRRLPRGCTPRWLKLDRAALERSGGVAIGFGDQPWLDSVANHLGEHPWAESSARPRSTPRARFPTDR